MDECLDGGVIASLQRLGDGPGGGHLAPAVTSFLSEAAGVLAELRSAATAGHWLDAARLAHRLNGSSAMFGAARLPRLCAELEQGIYAADWPATRVMLVAVEEEFVVVDRALRHVFGVAVVDD